MTPPRAPVALRDDPRSERGRIRRSGRLRLRSANAWPAPGGISGCCPPPAAPPDLRQSSEDRKRGVEPFGRRAARRLRIESISRSGGSRRASDRDEAVLHPAGGSEPRTANASVSLARRPSFVLVCVEFSESEPFDAPPARCAPRSRERTATCDRAGAELEGGADRPRGARAGTRTRPIGAGGARFAGRLLGPRPRWPGRSARGRSRPFGAERGTFPPCYSPRRSETSGCGGRRARPRTGRRARAAGVGRSSRRSAATVGFAIGASAGWAIVVSGVEVGDMMHCSVFSLPLLGWNYFVCADADEDCTLNGVLTQLVRAVSVLSIRALPFTSSMTTNVTFGSMAGIGTVDRLEKKAKNSIADATEDPARAEGRIRQRRVLDAAALFEDYD
ncbi:hypothetical protein ACHAWF_013120 [Thalassiosira exigua]